MPYTATCRSSRQNFKTAWQIPPMLKTPPIDHPNPTYTLAKLQSQSLSSSQIISPHRKSPTANNVADRNSVVEAKARVNGGVPPSEEHPVIPHLRKIISMKSDQTIIQRLDSIDLDSLPEVEQFLESSRVRYDFDLTTRSLLIKMTSPSHECGVRKMRQLFEPRMDELTSKYGGIWKYDTNRNFRLSQERVGVTVPSSLSLTPDGAVSDSVSGLTLALEVSASQSLKDARTKIHSYFRDRSVIAGIVLNLDEKPAYASPDTSSDWDSNSAFMKLEEWGIGCDAWGPRYFGGHCWGGEYTCQIEIHWPTPNGNHYSVTARLIPPCPEEITAINEELSVLWRELVKAHFKDRFDEIDLGSDPFLDIESFHYQLSSDLHETAYRRYSDEWFLANQPLELDGSAQADQPDERLERAVAAEARQAARLLKRRRTDDGEQGSRKQGKKKTPSS